MRYFVISLDGQKYGPADIPTLQRWIDEGRILPNTFLEEEIGGARLQAGGVLALRFAPQAPTQTANPYAAGNPYSQNPYGAGGPVAPQDLSQNPYASGNYSYQAPTDAYGFAARSNLNNAWVCGAIGLTLATMGVCCGVGPLIGIVLGAIGINSGKKAKEAGHPNGQSAYIFNIVVLVISVALLILSIAFLASGSLD